MILSEAEIRELTGRKWRKAQKRELIALGGDYLLLDRRSPVDKNTLRQGSSNLDRGSSAPKKGA